MEYYYLKYYQLNFYWKTIYSVCNELEYKRLISDNDKKVVVLGKGTKDECRNAAKSLIYQPPF